MDFILAHLVGLAVGAFSLVIFWVLFTRVVDNTGLGADAGPKADAGGQTIFLGGKTYGLHRGIERWYLSLPVGAPHTFSVRREKGLEKLGEELHVMVKVPTGDAHFDEEFEVRSHDADWTKVFFADEESRRLVRELFGLAATAVVLSKGRLQAGFAERSALAEGGPALSELAARLPGA